MKKSKNVNHYDDKYVLYHERRDIHFQDVDTLLRYMGVLTEFAEIKQEEVKKKIECLALWEQIRVTESSFVLRIT